MLDKVTALLFELRDPNNPTPSYTKSKLALANRIRNIRVREAKMDFNRHMADKLTNAATTFNTKEIHKIIKATALGQEINHAPKRTISLRLPNGKRAINDKENMSVMLPHCQRIFNNHKAVSPQALLHMKQRPIIQALDDDFSDIEIRTALRNMKNDKAPGSNGIPIEALKAMDETNFDIVREFLNKFWNNEADYDEWHSGAGTPIPKTINPDDPNKFRIINLMDVSSKLFSKIMTTRAQSLMAKYGTTYQFGATPNVGCQDGSHVLHMATQLRHQHNLETYVVFADLVKAYDTSNHKLIAEILKKLGAPPKFRNAIERLYTDLTVQLKIGKEKATIAQTVGVRQGDNLSPVIFLMIMTAFSEILDMTWTSSNIPKPKFHRYDMSNTKGAKLTGHNITRDFRNSSAFNTYHILYLDDGSFLFQSRTDLVNGLDIINNIFNSMGLEMHVGKGDTKSKTEAMYFPTSSFFKKAIPATITHTTESDTTMANPADDTHDHTTGHTTYSKLTQQQRERMYHESANTNRVYLQDETSHIDFVAHFKYLGTYISFDLSADYDINNRITKASREMGRLRYFFDNQYVELSFKHQVFLQYIVNILLWGCESWAIKDNHLRKINSFIHRSIRRILHIRMSQVIDDHIKNLSIRKAFFNLPTAENLIAIRSMTYLGKLTRGPISNPAKQLLTAFVNNPRAIGGVIMTNKKSLVKHLNVLLPELHTESTTTDPTTGQNTTRIKRNKDGDVHLWYDIAMDEDKWDEHINKLRHPGIENPPRHQRNRNRRHRRDPPHQDDDGTNDYQETQDHNQEGDQEEQQEPPQQEPPPPPPPPPSPQQQHQHQGTGQNHQSRSNQHQHQGGNGRQHHNQQPEQPPPEPEPTANHTYTNYNVENVGRTLLDSLKSMGLNLTATTRDVRTRFRILSMIYHPDKYSPAILDISPLEAQAHFQLINNAHAYLRTCNL